MGRKMKKKRILLPLCAALLVGLVLTGCNGGDDEEKPTPAPTGDNEIDVSDWFSDPTASPEPTVSGEPQSPSETPAPLPTAEVTPDVSAKLTPQVTPVGRLTEPPVTPGENTPTPTRRPDAQIPASPGLEPNGSGGHGTPTATPNPQDEGWLDGWY